jgi:transposase
MLALPPSVRVFLATGATDIRKSFDGLSALAQSVLEQDPLSGHLFVFCNRRRDRLKILYWDRSGFWILHKRLEKGTFAWPREDDSAGVRLELTSNELGLLLAGIDLSQGRRRRWYQRA